MTKALTSIFGKPASDAGWIQPPMRGGVERERACERLAERCDTVRLRLRDDVPLTRPVRDDSGRVVERESINAIEVSASENTRRARPQIVEVRDQGTLTVVMKRRARRDGKRHRQEVVPREIPAVPGEVVEVPFRVGLRVLSDPKYSLIFEEVECVGVDAPVTGNTQHLPAPPGAARKLDALQSTVEQQQAQIEALLERLEAQVDQAASDDEAAPPPLDLPPAKGKKKSKK